MAKRRLTQAHLETLFARPKELYDLLAGRPGYKQKPPIVEGDGELIITDVTTCDCVLAVCMVHQAKQAFVMLLDSEAIAAAMETLAEAKRSLATSINLQQLLEPGPFSRF